MKKLFILSLLLVQFSVVFSKIKTHCWEPVELSFTAQKTDHNPYMDVKTEKNDDLLQVVFTGTKGEAAGKSSTIIGFWDGKQNWKVRFSAPCEGEWKYESRSADPGLNGKKGKISVVKWTDDELKQNPSHRGFVKVCTTGERPGRYFEYSDGTPFLWIGDTWWNWCRKGIVLSRFYKVVDDRAQKGFNIGQLYMHSWGGYALDSGFTVLNIAHMQRLDSMIRYANSKGITIFLSPWWSGKDINKTIGAENMQRFCRYIMHRYAAYNVVWGLGSEYNMWNYGGLGLQFWKDLGSMMDKEDPYDRIISVHPTPGGWDAGDIAPQWSTAEVLHNEPWLDYNQSQTGHDRQRNDMAPVAVQYAYQLKPEKPIVVTETWYEFKLGNAPAEDVRFAAWSSILSGAAGHTYGGGHQWIANTPETPVTKMYWPFDTSFTNYNATLDYPGAVGMSVLANFLRSVDWWNLSPHPELVIDYPVKYCLALPGKEYVLFLRYGGFFRMDMKDINNSDEFEYFWLNPVNGKKEETKIFKGKTDMFFYAPYVKVEDPKENQAWVFYMKKK